MHCPDPRNCQEQEPFIPECDAPECEFPLNPDCIISGEDVSCDSATDSLYPDVTHEILGTKKNLTGALENINEQLCYIFSKEYIQRTLEIIRDDVDLKEQFCNLTCTCPCKGGPDDCICPGNIIPSVLYNSTTSLYDVTWDFSSIGVVNPTLTVGVAVYPVISSVIQGRSNISTSFFAADNTITISLPEGDYKYSLFTSTTVEPCTSGYSGTEAIDEDSDDNCYIGDLSLSGENDEPWPLRMELLYGEGWNKIGNITSTATSIGFRFYKNGSSVGFMYASGGPIDFGPYFSTMVAGDVITMTGLTAPGAYWDINVTITTNSGTPVLTHHPTFCPTCPAVEILLGTWNPTGPLNITIKLDVLGP